MPIRDRILWGCSNPFSDPRLRNLDQLIRDIRRRKALPFGVAGGSVFHNYDADLPTRPDGHYKEYDVEIIAEGAKRTQLRIVLGEDGEIFISGNHYRDFRQIVGLPE